MTKSAYKYAKDYWQWFAMGAQTKDNKGNVLVPIVCVFCNEKFTALRRSFLGTGKKCPRCGAHYGADNIATPTQSWVDGQGAARASMDYQERRSA